jgi:hypothetical protein
MVRHLVLVAALTVSLAIGSFAQESMKAPAHAGKVTVIVTHEVKDYAAWRKVFDTDELNRKHVGFTISGVYADVQHPNLVSVVGEFPSAAAAEAFTSSPKLKEVMAKGGVMGKPDVKILVVAPK